MTQTTPQLATRLANRSLIRLSGDDVRGFLQGLVTQDVQLVQPDAPQWSGLLTAQGKALFDFLIWADGDDLLIDCEADQRDALIKRLSMYRLRRPIAISPTEGSVHWSAVPGNGVPDPRLAALGWRWIGSEDGEEATGWTAHRLSLGVAEGAEELGQDKTLWLECNAAELNGVSYTKGCYVGQENTARMNWRAKVNRRLVVAPLSEASDRTRVSYPELGLMVEHRRVEALGDAMIPSWLSQILDGA